MLKLLIWTYKWLAKSARTFDLWGCKKSVVDEETPVRSILIGQNVLFVSSIILLATAFYLCMKGCDVLASVCILVWFAGFIVLWRKGEKITVTIDKSLKAEPNKKLIAEWCFPGYCDLCFAVNNEENLVAGKYDNDVAKDVDYAGTVSGSVLYGDGITIEVNKADVEVTTDTTEVLGPFTVTTTIPEYISEACLKMMDESVKNMKDGKVSEPIDFWGLRGRDE